MKKTMIFLSFILTASSCTVFNDKDEVIDPREKNMLFMHDQCLESVFGAIKLTDFFDRYQDIREDRGAAILLGMEYFEDGFLEKELVYEGYMAGYDFGEIRATETEDSYIVAPSFSGYYSYNEIIYTATVLGDRRYRLTTAPETRQNQPEYFIGECNINLECTAFINSDNEIVIESLELKYIEDLRKQDTIGYVTSTSEPVRIHMDKAGPLFGLPNAGILDFDIRGNMFSDRFSVRYTTTKPEIL